MGRLVSLSENLSINMVTKFKSRNFGVGMGTAICYVKDVGLKAIAHGYIGNNDP